MKTKLEIESSLFLINNKLVYSEQPNMNPNYEGLLMNARMIQGVFDDKKSPQRFNRYGKSFSAAQNTDDLIVALPEWYEKGLRAITVGFQGGGSCFTINSYTIENNPFGEDGLSIDKNYLSRMDAIINKADQIGMVVIVSLFYGFQTRFLKNDIAVINAVKTASNWLRDQKYTNVIIEIANEQDADPFKCHPILYTGNGIVELINIAKRESGGIPVGCSGQGGVLVEEIAQASDVIFIHGNGQNSQQFYNLILRAKKIAPPRPIVCNEDSQAISRINVALREGVSWGYYNNMTKQEPPTCWGITKGEDFFFATRMAIELGLEELSLPLEEQFYLQGLEAHMTYEGKRWIRLASLFPEKINYVEFYRNKKFLERAYEDPFMMNSSGNTWTQNSFPEVISKGEIWEAKVFLYSGEVVVKTVIVS